MLHVLGRCVLATAGFTCACLAASAFLHLVTVGLLGIPAQQISGPVSTSLYVSIPFVAMVVAYFAFMPALVVVVVGELAGLRSWTAYALGGGAVAAIIALWRVPGPDVTVDGVPVEMAQGPVPEPQLIAILLAAGMVGGIGHWFVAGRSAGRAMRRDP